MIHMRRLLLTSAACFVLAGPCRIDVPANEVVRVDSPVLQADRSDVHKDLSGKELTELPLLGLVPGVTPPVDSNSVAGNPAGSFVTNVNGTSQSNINMRVDGASNTYLRLPHLPDHVLPIVTKSYDAEQGFASGAVVSVETKSGGNAFHLVF